jgi:hypothetical protein
MIEARVRDFRIDSRLQKLCGKYLVELCGSMDAYELDETDLNTCLQVGHDAVCSHTVIAINTCLQVGRDGVCRHSTCSQHMPAR